MRIEGRRQRSMAEEEEVVEVMVMKEEKNVEEE